MGRLTREVMQIDKIRAFLEVDTEKISGLSSVGGGLVSIVVLGIAMQFLKGKELWMGMCIVLCILIMGSILYYGFKIEHNQINRSYAYGIYSICGSICLIILSYILLKLFWGRSAMHFSVAMFVLSVVAGIISCRMYIESIDTTTDSVEPLMIPLTALVACSTGGSSFMFYGSFHPRLLFGVLMGICSIIVATGVRGIIRAKCYEILEKEEKEREIPENQMIFIEKSNDRFCEDAKAWLKEKKIDYCSRNITEKSIWLEEIKLYHEKSDFPISDFFDKRASAYKSMKLKDRLPKMTVEEQYELLASSNTLLKLPIIFSDDIFLIGFKEYEWEEKINIEKNK